MGENRTPFSDEQIKGVYRAIHERRDIRAYRPDAVGDDVLHRLLEAAHHAPSVGFMQPWNFILITDKARRQALYEHFLQCNEEASQHFEGERKLKYDSLKLQGILDASVNIVFTCDRSRGGKHVLGRNTIPDTDIYSTCLAIENFWLAARAEGLGVGWMSIHKIETLHSILEIPEHVLPVAYLTLGHPVSFPDAPLLESTGWRAREDLTNLVYENVWGQPKEFAPKEPASRTISHSQRRTENDTAASGTDQIAHEAETVRHRLDHLTKPRGSLGDLEEWIVRLATIQKRTVPLCDHPHILLFAGDHGIAAHHISAYEQHVTAQMMYQYVAGTAAINSIARANGISLSIYDVGVNHDFENAEGIHHRKVRMGTRDFQTDCAMTPDEFRAAYEHGRSAVLELPDTCSLLGLGEMGIGNTTAASAIACALLCEPAEKITGAGTGIGPDTRKRKIEIIEKGLSLHRQQIASAMDAVARLGGYEIASLAGAIEGAFEKNIPVVLDGFITGVAALAAVQHRPEVLSVLIAGHCSKEKAHAHILAKLNLRPILNLNLRLGEGSGAALAMGLIANACRLYSDMKTFEEANIIFAENEQARL